jgi:membrane-associated phospholipid phosphatase
MAAAMAATTTLLTVAATAAATAATPASAHRPPPRPNVVVEWNQALLTIAQTPGAVPATMQPTRAFAIMSAAVFDAVDAIDRDGPQYRTRLVAPRTASQRAAAATAAHDVLRGLFPSFADSLDQRLAADLAAEPAVRSRDAGARVGAQAAAALLALRANDGSTATPPAYVTTGQPGDFRPTPPAMAAPVFTHWAAVTPFLLSRGDRFRPPPPPALPSRDYADAIDEVRRLGQDTSTTRTPEQTTIGQFWAGPIQNYWNAITETVVLAHRSDTAASARVFALVDLGLADATIAMYDAKYTYRLWRPITAIRLADTDGNPRTAGDPAWTPLATTPADPSYPGAHSTLSATAATVLAAAYGDRTSFSVTSPLTPGVTRSFSRFSAAVTEAGLSRIYAGIHTRIDHRAGVALGTRVGADTLVQLARGNNCRD